MMMMMMREREIERERERERDPKTNILDRETQIYKTYGKVSEKILFMIQKKEHKEQRYNIIKVTKS